MNKKKSETSQPEMGFCIENKECVRQRLAELVKFQVAVVLGEATEDPSPHYLSNIFSDFQKKMVMLGLDCFTQCCELREELKKRDEVPQLLEENRALQSQNLELESNLRSRSAAVRKAQAELKKVQVEKEKERKEFSAKLDEATKEVKDLETSLGEAKAKMERMQRGEDLDICELVDSEPFAQVREAWDEMSLRKLRRALGKFYPTLDLSFLDDGIPVVDEEEEAAVDDEAAATQSPV